MTIRLFLERSKIRNETGNITLALAVILVVVGMTIMLVNLLLNINGVTMRGERETEDIYKRDEVMEVVKYGLYNEVTGLNYTSFTKLTPLVTNLDVITFETNINKTLKEWGSTYTVTLEPSNVVIIETYCDNLYDYTQLLKPKFIGMKCDYVPFNVEFKVKLKDSKGEQIESSNVVLRSLYLYESSKKLYIDKTTSSIILK